MTTEQREAIDRLKNLLAKGKYAVAGKTLLYEDYYMLKNVLEVVENQEQKIIKQQEEIENLKNKEVLIKRYFQKCDLIKQKDKIIDLMAEYMAINGVEANICNEKRIEENCKNVTVDNIPIHRCKNCIKQYFENKANSKIQ